MSKKIVFLVLSLFSSMSFARGIAKQCNTCIKDHNSCISKTIAEADTPHAEAMRIAEFCQNRLDKCSAKFECDVDQVDQIDPVGEIKDSDAVESTKINLRTHSKQN